MSYIYPEKQLRHQVILDAGVVGDPLWAGERITWLLNQAQLWLQLELIRQGYGNWITIANQGLADTTIFDSIAVSRGNLPTTYLKELPPIVIHTSVANSRPVSLIDVPNFIDLVRNPYSAPTSRQPIGFLDYTTGAPAIIVYPATGTVIGTIQYHKIISDLTYDNNSIPSQIPIEHIPKLIEKVVAEVVGIKTMDERSRQAKLAQIDKEVKERYQLSKVVPQSESPEKDKKVLQ